MLDHFSRIYYHWIYDLLPLEDRAKTKML